MANPNKYVCIHGHFYQPPRENAWLEVVEQQESARPWHDWNERINHECYAANAAARIQDGAGQIFKIRNNYNRISFNFGPTLLHWLEQKDPDAYRLLQAADRRSQERFGGHGSALAQVHSHLILPLANYRDKVTQVYWGVCDFEHRFGRYPEGIWLAETAADTETLEVLAAHGIQFTILAPGQAKAFRKIDATDWKSTTSALIDTRRAYWCNLPSGRRIALFFYDGETAQAVAFNGLLNSGKAFAGRLTAHFDKDDTPQLAHIATDGETFGHHHRFGEMALADCLNSIEDGDAAQLINYGHFLELHPPTHEAQIHENSSWSCVHGVERWRANCGCCSGQNPGWHQRWRAPLRETLDWLRDQLAPRYEQAAQRFLRDPWAARNEYIQLMLDRSDATVVEFLKKHRQRELSENEEVTALRLLEMQRHALLMFTSCGWFFDEISGIETNQILQYALRALDYAQDLLGEDLHDEFLRRLAAAPSNTYPNGAASFKQNVLPTRVTLERVATHFAVASIFEANPAALDFFNYTVAPEFFEKMEAGVQRLAVGRLGIRSRITHAERTFSFAVLYLGQQHIIGNVSGEMPRSIFDGMAERTIAAFRSAQLGGLIGILQEFFGPEKFTLDSLFTDEKIQIIRSITAESLQRAEADFRTVFKDNYQLMAGLLDVGLPVPDAWRNITTFVLNADLLQFFKKEKAPQGKNWQGADDIRTLRRIADDFVRWKVSLTEEETLRHAAGQFILLEINQLAAGETTLARLNRLCQVLEILGELKLEPDIWRSQNVFYLATKGQRKGLWVFAGKEWERTFRRLGGLLKVKLGD